MVKRGGTKRKAVITKITDKNSKATTFTKRRDGLFSKAAQLCVLGDAQIAILATPSSSNSNVSFFSFGHSSVDAIVSAYLTGQRPAPPVREESKEMREDIGICMARKELGLGYWWDDEKLARSNDPQEIMQAMESMEVLHRDAQRLLEGKAFGFYQREEGSLAVGENMSKSDIGEQTLIDVDDLLPQNLITTEDDQIMSVFCDSFCNNDNYNAALSTTHAALSTTHAEEKLQEWSDTDFEQFLNDFEKAVEEDDHHQIVAVSENSCNNNNNNNALLLPAASGDFNLADLDLDTGFEGFADLDHEFVASFLM